MIAIRRYRASDCGALADLFRRSVHEIASHDYSSAQLAAWAPDAIDMEKFTVRRASKPTFIAEMAGHIAGFSDLEADGHIDMLYVDPDFARKGVASTLLAHIEDLARRNGLSQLFSEASITARPVFERRGFAALAEQMVTRNGQNFRNFRMEKRL